MGANDHIREQASREVWRNSPFRVRCKIMSYDAFAEPSPTCVVVPYVAFDSVSSFDSEAEWMQENMYELPVNFPGTQKFHVDPEQYDAFIDSPIEYARDCYPVPTTQNRRDTSRVQNGWTQEEVIDQSIDPNSIQMRIIRSRQKIESFKKCEDDGSQDPMVSRKNEIWFGNIRQKLDDGLTDVWTAPNRFVARLQHKTTTYVTERLNYPVNDGTQVTWRDRIEHPFQRDFGSSSVVNYPRFLTTLSVDPGYIIGVVQNLRDFFKSLDYDNGRQKVETFKTYDVVDFREDLPEA